jgi:branched-subunit amino acid aminotransferase/4-amino-4-deoxychorismate lyase
MSGSTISRLSFDEVIDRLLAMKEPFHKNYLAMYSSWFGGIITDPAIMMVPVDDHLVHRGDGVFEAFKCVAWKVYALDRHLSRMERSAAGSSLTMPVTRPELVETVLATIRAANVPDCIIRIFVSRGPGGFSTNPYECPSSQLYVIVTALHTPAGEKYEWGVSLKTSRVPIKKGYFANLKSCNYLPNVLMKKEAEDAKVDFTISIDEEGFIGEGATENAGIITKGGEFLVPRFDRILRGITISRLMELARKLVDSGDLAGVGEADITPRQAYEASEIMMFGTSFDVLPVVEYDGRKIGDGRPGPFHKRFLELLRQDMRSSPEMLTSVKD